MSLSFTKWILIWLAVAALLSGCGNTPGRSALQDRSSEPQSLPRDYENALALMRNGNHVSAIASMKAFIEAEPGLAGPWLNLGIACRLSGDTDGALEALNRAIELSPDNAAAYQQLGIVYRERGQFDAAHESYERALTLDPDYALAHRNLGILYDLYLQRPDSALHHYRKYLELTADSDSDVKAWVIDLDRRFGDGRARMAE